MLDEKQEDSLRVSLNVQHKSFKLTALVAGTMSLCVTTGTVSHRTNTVVICIRHNVTVSALTTATMMTGVGVPAQSLHDVYISYTDVKTLLHYIFYVKF